MKKPESIQGRHRSAELAERHRRDLERKLGMDVEITARRNSKGEFSPRGRFFTFTPIPPEAKDFEDFSLTEFEQYMDDYDGDLDYMESEGSGEYGEE